MPTLLARLPAVLGVLLMLLSLPVSLPLALAWDAWVCRRQRGVADRTRCLRCGRVLGQAAMRAAHADHIEALGAMQRQVPHGHVHLLKRVDARCTTCGATYAWDRRRELLHPTKDATSAGEAPHPTRAAPLAAP